MQEVPVVVVEVIGVAVVLLGLVAALITVHVIVVPLVHPVLSLVGLSDFVRLEGLRILPRCGWDLRHELSPSSHLVGDLVALDEEDLFVRPLRDLPRNAVRDLLGVQPGWWEPGSSPMPNVLATSSR
jgi:hypothetical protein